MRARVTAALAAGLLFLGAGAGTGAHAQSGLPDDVVIPQPETEEEPTPEPETPRLRVISLVMVDPGHGGEDAGTRAANAGLVEKTVALAIAGKAEARISEDTGARVRLTRAGDERVAVTDRAAFANEARADLFVSIHANASPSPRARGFQVFYHDSSEVNPRGSAPGAEPWSQAQKDVEAESARFAEILRESLAAKVALPDRGVTRTASPVLEGATCPAVLVEVVGSSRVDLQACKLEYSIVSPK